MFGYATTFSNWNKKKEENKFVAERQTERDFKNSNSINTLKSFLWKSVAEI